MNIQLTKRGNQWTTMFMGKERHVILESELVNWRSLGIIPTDAVEFEVDLDGTIIKISTVHDGAELTELEIPKNHSVAKMVRPTKPYQEVPAQ